MNIITWFEHRSSSNIFWTAVAFIIFTNMSPPILLESNVRNFRHLQINRSTTNDHNFRSIIHFYKVIIEMRQCWLFLNLLCSKQSAIAFAIVSVKSQLEAVNPSTVVFLAKAAKNFNQVSWSIPWMLFKLISMQSDSFPSTYDLWFIIYYIHMTKQCFISNHSCIYRVKIKRNTCFRTSVISVVFGASSGKSLSPVA